ncbi:MAG: 30S ribosomal protein S17e [Candidatus Altarchaeum sp.]|nr:30S ribosomal protein S17e [Candidatus Altarchaeum sp.]
MGRIKQTYIKRAGMEIYRTHKEELTGNFEANKEKVNEYTDIDSKPVKNKIAGYLTKYVKRMQKKEAKDTGSSQENVKEDSQESGQEDSEIIEKSVEVAAHYETKNN